MLGKYNGSFAKLLETVYPDYEWLPWKFEMAPRHFWENTANQKKYLDWLAKELNVSPSQITRKVNKIKKFPIECKGFV